MTDPRIVAEALRETLKRMPLAAAYLDEQRHLQPDVQRAIQESLHRSFPVANLRTTISVGGTGKPNLKLYGTSFWPDIEVTEDEARLAAVEVKLIRPGHRASKALAEAIGQSIIYSIRYPHVFAFVVHGGRSDARLHEEDTGLEKRLLQFNVELVVRRSDGAIPKSHEEQP